MAFMRLKTADGKEIAVNVETIAGVVGPGARTKGSTLLLTGGHEVEVYHSISYIMVNLQRMLAGREPLPDEDPPDVETP